MATKTKVRAESMNGDAGVHDAGILPAPRRMVQEAAVYSRDEAAALVGWYYSAQKQRIGAGNKISAHERRVDQLPDTSLIRKIKGDLASIERDAERGLSIWAKAQPLGRWAMQIAGVGPVIAAGLLSQIDLKRCCCPNWRHLKAGDRDGIPPHDCPGLVTAGAIWRFAGLLDPEQQRWERGQRRPYSQFLHTLCYKLGESFKRAGLGDDKMARTDEELAAMPEARRKAFLTRRDGLLRGDSYLYARLYRERKRLEVERNDAGAFAERASRLKEEAIKRGVNVYRKSDKAERSMGEVWDSGRLQDCGLDLRAARYAVKIFLSHWHTVGREILGLPVVKPWVIEHGGHAHYIPPPLWPMGS